MDFTLVLHDVVAWAEAHGIVVTKSTLKPDHVGHFDGISATLNETYSAEELTYYFAHALGSIVRWSLSREKVQAMFDELRDAKKEPSDSARLERAIELYRAFEIESSEFAVTMLAELGHEPVIGSYTNFMRADLEALSEFHRTGRAPVWRAFSPAGTPTSPPDGVR